MKKGIYFILKSTIIHYCFCFGFKILASFVCDSKVLQTELSMVLISSATQALDAWSSPWS